MDVKSEEEELGNDPSQPSKEHDVKQEKRPGQMINWPVHGNEGRITPPQVKRDDERKHKPAKIKKEEKKKKKKKGGGEMINTQLY